MQNSAATDLLLPVVVLLPSLLLPYRALRGVHVDGRNGQD